MDYLVKKLDPSGTMPRAEFIAIQVAFSLIVVGVAWLHLKYSWDFYITWLIISALSYILAISQVQRSNHVGLSRVAVVIGAIPFISTLYLLVLCVVPGMKVEITEDSPRWRKVLAYSMDIKDRTLVIVLIVLSSAVSYFMLDQVDAFVSTYLDAIAVTSGVLS